MNVKILYFTDNGSLIAEKIGNALDAEMTRCSKKESKSTLSVWTCENFHKGNTLVYIGAAGIAVRAIAPYMKSKTEDPAVLVIDELGQFVIPMLSGHLGGANQAAKTIAKILGAQPVLTTATDINGVFAIDDWAREMNCGVVHKERIQEISSALLRGEAVGISSDFPISGEMPQGLYLTDRASARAVISLKEPNEDQLGIIPKILTLGIGCRKAISADEVETLFKVVLTENGICEMAVKNASSIDIKKNEKGLMEFCQNHSLNLTFFSADELQSVEGEFRGSAFVRKTVGVDNVCERSAVLHAKGKLVVHKKAENGVTMALAMTPCTLEWR